MKFGIKEVIHPYSTEKIRATKELYYLGKTKYKVQKDSDSILGDKIIATEAAISAISTVASKKSEYVAIEVFTDEYGHIKRTNICHMRHVES